LPLPTAYQKKNAVDSTLTRKPIPDFNSRHLTIGNWRLHPYNPQMPKPTPRLSHTDKTGKAKMVNVGHKPATPRTATAEGYITLQRSTLQAIADNKVPKGEVLSVARLAGIMAAKRTGDLIPLCHPLGIESVEVDFDLPDLHPENADPVKLRIKSTAKITAKTGVEMEALTAVSIAALTIYDMCKAIDKTMGITGIRLINKTK
jgi:cyclic pyranopterin phosphate synthase